MPIIEHSIVCDPIGYVVPTSAVTILAPAQTCPSLKRYLNQFRHFCGLTVKINIQRQTDRQTCDICGNSFYLQCSCCGLAIKIYNRVPSLLGKKSRSFPVQFQNFPGAFGHSSQPKYIKYETFITDVHHSLLGNTN